MRLPTTLLLRKTMKICPTSETAIGSVARITVFDNPKVGSLSPKVIRQSCSPAGFKFCECAALRSFGSDEGDGALE